MLVAAVIEAAAQGRLEELKHFLGQGGNRQTRDPIQMWTPLWWAHVNSHHDCVWLLRLPLAVLAVELGRLDTLHELKRQGFDFWIECRMWNR